MQDLRLSLVAFASLLAACSSNPSPSSPLDASSQPSDADAGAEADASGPRPDGGPSSPTAAVVVTFDPAQGQLPEGLAMAGGVAYVGLAPSGAIERVDLATGQVSHFASLPAPVPGKGFMTGLAVGATGAVYAGLVSFVTDVKAGIYRAGPEGGVASLIAEDPALTFPNGLSFDASGQLWVTDSGSGSIFRFGPSGEKTRWVTGALLAGDPTACGAGLGPGFAVGANGLVVEDDAVYVTNTDKATIVRIARLADGSAGAPAVVVGPSCKDLGGADGLVRAGTDFIVAVNRQDKIVRARAQGTIETIMSGGALDFPATVAWSDDALLVTSFAFERASAGSNPHPALLRVLGAR